MITSQQCLARFGDPSDDKQRLAFERQWMTLWTPPPNLPALPRRIYCHKYLVEPLHQAIDNLLDARLVQEIKTWDGCFNVRVKKGNPKALSLHAWGLAVDINAAWNQFGTPGAMRPEVVRCFTGAGFDWGGNWKMPTTDGMHFQLAALPEA